MALENGKVVELLGEKVERWSPKGINFLRCRVVGAKWRRTALHALKAYGEGRFGELVPEDTRKEVAQVFGKTNLEPEALIIIALGRPATKSKEGKWQEVGQKFDEETDEGQQQKAAAERLKALLTPEETEEERAAAVKAEKKTRKGKKEEPTAEAPVEEVKAEEPEPAPKVEEVPAARPTPRHGRRRQAGNGQK